jgi:hypothetical protein
MLDGLRDLERMTMTAPAGRLAPAHNTGLSALRHRLARLRRGSIWARPASAIVGPPPTLTPGERILATESLPGRHAMGAQTDESHTDASHVVATTQALHLRGPAGWRRVAWDETVRVSWDPRRCVLHVLVLTGPPVTVTLAPDSWIGALVRERVEATVLTSRRTTVAGVRITVVARRRPGTTEPIWHVHLSSGADADRPDIVEAIESTIHHLRAELGL